MIEPDEKNMESAAGTSRPPSSTSTAAPTTKCGMSANIAWNQPLYCKKWKCLSSIGKYHNDLSWPLHRRRSRKIASDSMRHADATITAVTNLLCLMCHCRAAGLLRSIVGKTTQKLRYQVVIAATIMLVKKHSLRVLVVLSGDWKI